MSVEVSVIVPTIDSESLLARCLASVDSRQGVDAEAVVVDQGSLDRTAEIAQAAGARVVRLPRPRVYTPPTRSRNVGARLARGRYLLHLDADMELRPGTLATCVEACELGGHVALTLHEVDRGQGFWAACKALERRCYWGFEGLEAARFVRADLFRTVGGYDEDLGSGEDWDVHRRYLGHGSIGESPVPLIHHLGRLTLSGQLKKKFAYGRSARAFLRKGGTGTIGAGMWRAYWRSRRNLAKDPVHAAGFVALRSAELAALGLGLTVDSLARAAPTVSRAD